MEKVKITVTQDDIDNGIPCAAGECPVARAATRAFETMTYAGPDDLMVVDAGGSAVNATHIYILPAKARKFINRFDAERVVKPFEFTVKRLTG